MNCCVFRAGSTLQSHLKSQLSLARNLNIRHHAVLVLVEALEEMGVAAVLVEVNPANLNKHLLVNQSYQGLSLQHGVFMKQAK